MCGLKHCCCTTYILLYTFLGIPGMFQIYVASCVQPGICACQSLLLTLVPWRPAAVRVIFRGSMLKHGC